MTEQKLQEAIRRSAQDVEVPERLAPEEIEKRLRQRGKSTQKSRMTRSWKQLSAAAAVLVLAVALAVVVGQQEGQKESGGAQGMLADGQMKDAVGLDKTAGSGADDSARAEEENAGSEDGSTREDDEAEITFAAREPKADAGDMFTVAKNYDQVYALLEENRQYYCEFTRTNGIMKEEQMFETAEDESMSAALPREEAAADTGNFRGHSDTNVQTEGVDESDIVKTDGNYIYAVRQDGIIITDISGEAMAPAGEIRLEDAGARVKEMYVQGDILNLILQQADSQLEQGTEEGQEADVFYMDTQTTTRLLTYDISDRTSPALVGELSQDGSYYTSRKIGTVVYLFTTEYEMTQIPRIGGCEIAYDCIYLPKQGSRGLLVSSVDVKKPSQVLDQVMVVNEYAEIYVSTGAMYLYQFSWQDQNPVTQIAKFTLNKGKINAVGSASVKGQIQDTFAINEGGGQLRVLTTDWGGEEEVNHLYVLDETLKLTGSLQGLAPGEEIYSARFLGNMAYFVTYRNVDPLFAVDLSDPAKPVVVSELKITGFSEYLHFWGEDKLLGIGYETDPDTGRTQGIKLTMFDITNPAEPAVLDCMVQKELDHSPALYDYKTVLADEDANLFGFAGVDYQESREADSYYLYQWGENGFERLLKEELDTSDGGNGYRGLYSGGRFYLAGPEGITSYDREKGYERIESLKY